MSFFDISNLDEQFSIDKFWQPSPKVNLYTDLSELVEIYNCRDAYYNEALLRLNRAADYVWCLKQIITELEEFENPIMSGVWDEDFCQGVVPLNPKDWPAEYLAYQVAKNGYDGNLSDFAHCFIHRGSDGKFHLTTHTSMVVKDIKSGMSKAYALPKLKKLLEEYESGVLDTPTVPYTKLKWKGTPAQFGFIMQELIGKGFIEAPAPSNNKVAAAFLEHFQIETTPSTLAKELSSSESGNSLSSTNRSKFKIPEISTLK